MRYIFVLCFAIGIATVVFFGMNYLMSQKKKVSEVRESNQSVALRWDDLRASYAKVLSTITSYETDLMLAIQYPAMNDLMEDLTAEMYKKLSTFQSTMKRSKATGIGGDDELYDTLSRELADLEIATQKAEHNARRIALSKVSETDRKDLQQAKLLFQHVADVHNTPEVRKTYSERLQKVLDRINDRNNVQIVPQAIIHEINNTIRRELT